MASGENIRSDNKFMRLAVLLEPEIVRMVDGHVQRTQGAEETRFDAGRSVVAYVARGQLLWEARAEVIGSYLPLFSLWRWWWAGRIAHTGPKVSMDLAFAEGQRHGITAITSEQTGISSEDDAQLLANVCAHLARADGVLRSRDEEKVTFYALFDTGRTRRPSTRPTATPSIAAPPRSASRTTAPQPLGVNIASLSNLPDALPNTDVRLPSVSYAPPDLDDPFDAPREPSRVSLVPKESTTSTRMNTIAPGGVDPRAGLPIREPARDIFLPVAHLAFSAIHAVHPNGFHQGLLVIVVDASDGRARFSAIIVAAAGDASHNLGVVESPRELIEAVSKMIAADARSGNGPWRRLSARLSRTARGASVEIVVA